VGAMTLLLRKGAERDRTNEVRVDLFFKKKKFFIFGHPAMKFFVSSS